MKFSVSDLLDQLRGDAVLPLTNLEKKLALKTAVEKAQLQLALQALVKVGVIASAEEGISRGSNEAIFEARVRSSSKGFCFALREDGGEDVYLRDHQLNHAWNGDRVLVKVTREGGRRRSPEGVVQCILERANTTVLAQVEQQADQLVAVPLDDRLHAAIQLPELDASHAETTDTEVVEVSIDRFPVGQFPAQGHVSRSLKVQGSEADDRELLLARHRLSTGGFSGRVSLKVPAESGREDLTALPTVLLQGWTSKEAPLLPAVSLEALEDGAQRLWVHTPSVAERLALESPLERWMRQHGEALSLGSSWVALLPGILHKAAALAAGNSQDTLSVALDLGSDGTLQHFHFCRSQVLDGRVLDAWRLAAGCGSLGNCGPRRVAAPTAREGLLARSSSVELQMKFLVALIQMHVIIMRQQLMMTVLV
jgi:ribonuclease R